MVKLCNTFSVKGQSVSVLKSVSVLHRLSEEQVRAPVRCGMNSFSSAMHVFVKVVSQVLINRLFEICVSEGSQSGVFSTGNPSNRHLQLSGDSQSGVW